jgi:hypothetical protein
VTVQAETHPELRKPIWVGGTVSDDCLLAVTPK